MKNEAIKAAIIFLRAKLRLLEAQIKTTTKKASDAPGSMESWSDKSKDEFSQLADALSKELEPIKETIKELESSQSAAATQEVSVGSYVTVERDGEKEKYLMVSSYGGDEIVQKEGEKFFLLSSKTDLGKEIVNNKVGSKLTFRGQCLIVTAIN